MPKKNTDSAELPEGFEANASKLETLDKELSDKIAEASEETNVESAEVIRLGAVRFLKEANAALKQAHEEADRWLKIYGDTQVEIAKVEKAKAFITSESEKVNQQQLAMEKRREELEALQVAIERATK